MNHQTFEVLEFNRIKEMIASYALTGEGKKQVLNLFPSINKKQVQSWQDELSEAVAILKISSSVPVHGLEGMEQILKGVNKGVALKPEQLSKLLHFLDCSAKMRRFMKDKEFVAPNVASYIHSISELPNVAIEIQRCIRNGMIDDYASKELLKVRKQKTILEERLKEKVSQILKSSKYKAYLQEAVVSQRDGRFVIPIKKEYRNKIKGNVIDTSSSGSTIFLEPEELALGQEQLYWVLLEEEQEVEKILFYLTGLVESHEGEIRLAMETMIHYDFLFAKAKYIRVIDGLPVEINEDHHIQLINAKHPLLGANAVPLNIELGNGCHALVITGPNTGGKTVTIKTVGLFTLMVQSGLHLPVAEGSKMSIFHKVLVDIGDGQSIEQNLSTFSSRIVNIVEILKESNDRTLVLLDELGSGTDPSEGMGLATAILEQLYLKGCTLLTTTHYNEIKEFAYHHEGFINGSMEFDLDTLRPTYRLQIGKGGESQAFAIALKLGLHPKIIEKAHFITYKENKQYDNSVTDSRLQQELDKQIIINRHQNRIKKVKEVTNSHYFSMGDNVIVSPSKEIGIVYMGPDSVGNYIVQIKGEKHEINHKRLKLYISKQELYPEDYDFDIIFDSKDNRKKKKQMGKKYVEGLTIKHDE
ncbi:endonuclease MutS2 [Pseudoneobacillus rhizosphaerae]|uniref:Endonuclease MutS2 n=1 Tax=Pseudoneobacillus rhizosphaerae TaxID=2880968 RepID=A0A9C7GCX0_9BACI|nr:endonuclease MutS2 [Pseudoneobacillus rhizosphaerae]CAG9610229.1 Endonuclease MutS2 [Pseudoneobacillus rhizosphaerae]